MNRNWTNDTRKLLGDAQRNAPIELLDDIKRDGASRRPTGIRNPEKSYCRLACAQMGICGCLCCCAGGFGHLPDATWTPERQVVVSFARPAVILRSSGSTADR